MKNARTDAGVFHCGSLKRQHLSVEQVFMPSMV